MKIPFRTVTGNLFEIDIDPSKTLDDARVMLEEKIGVNFQNVQFIFGATILSKKKIIKDLGLKNSDFIVIHCPSQPIPVPKPNSIEVGPLEVDGQNMIEKDKDKDKEGGNTKGDISEEHKTIIDSFLEMGFEEEVVVRALEASNFNVERALNTLINNASNSPPSPPHQEREREPSTRRFGELQEAYESLTAEEKEAVKRLERLGLDSSTVLQVFLACEKNEELARDCISTMI